MTRRRRGFLALAVLSIVLAPTVSAAAQDDFVDVVDGPASSVMSLMPGSEASSDFVVTNESDGPATLHVEATDVDEDDNGCVRPEQDDGDVSCADGGGELGHWLEIRLLDVDGTNEHQVWAGSVHDLQAGADVLQQVAAAGAPRIRLEVVLPRDTPNETMSDAVRFGLRWTFTGTTESQTTVLGVQQGAGQADPPAGALADTGTAVTTATLVGIAALLVLGSILTAGSRRRDAEGPLDH